MPPVEYAQLFNSFTDAEDIRLLMNAQNFITTQLSTMKERLAKAEEEEEKRMGGKL